MNAKYPIPKIWTKTEQSSVKVTLTVSYRTGKTRRTTETILHPAKMESKHFNQLNKIIEKYGTTR